MHIREGELRAYQDGELEPVAAEQVEAHLAACERCRDKAARGAARAERVAAHFASLSPGKGFSPLSPGVARSRLGGRLGENQKENQSWWNQLGGRMPRSAWGFIRETETNSI